MQPNDDPPVPGSCPRAPPGSSLARMRDGVLCDRTGVLARTRAASVTLHRPLCVFPIDADYANRALRVPARRHLTPERRAFERQSPHRPAAPPLSATFRLNGRDRATFTSVGERILPATPGDRRVLPELSVSNQARRVRNGFGLFMDQLRSWSLARAMRLCQLIRESDPGMRATSSE